MPCPDSLLRLDMVKPLAPLYDGSVPPMGGATNETSMFAASRRSFLLSVIEPPLPEPPRRVMIGENVADRTP